jgi:hypothetical protein
MWIGKGILFGIWLFGFGTLAYLYSRLFRHLPPHTSVDARSIGLLTVSNVWWWVALAACLVLGLAVARAWAVPLAVWITMAVSGLIPASVLALFLVIVRKLKTSQG